MTDSTTSSASAGPLVANLPARLRRNWPFVAATVLGAVLAFALPMTFFTAPESEPVSMDGSSGGEQEGHGGAQSAPYQLSPHGQQMVGLTTGQVRSIPLVQTVETVGRVELNDARVSHITAWVNGRVETLYADTVGMVVKKGNHLLRLYSPQLYSAQQELVANIEARRRGGAMQEELGRLVELTRERLRLYGMQPEQIEQVIKEGPQPTVTIFAPQGGVVVAKPIYEGLYVKEGSMLVTVADFGTLWLFLDIYERDLPLIRQGQRVRVTTEATPGEVTWGRIDFIEPVLDPKTRSTRVRVTLPNPVLRADESGMPGSSQARRFSPGMFALAEIEVSLDASGHPIGGHLEGEWFCPMHPEVRADHPGDCDECGMAMEPAPEIAGSEDAPPPDVVAVPASAVLESGVRAVVYVQKSSTEAGRTFELREVQLGPRARHASDDADHTVYRVVLGGLTAGEVVAVNGNFLLDSQAQLEGHPSLFFPHGQARPMGGHQH